MKTLQMPLIKKWFDMTRAGVKTEDYREITPYWFKRLVYQPELVFKYCTGYDLGEGLFISEGLDHIARNKRSMIGFVPFETNVMTLGYPKSTDTDRILTLQHAGIEIRTGNSEWGAEPGKLYFVIKHGSII